MSKKTYWLVMRLLIGLSMTNWLVSVANMAWHIGWLSETNVVIGVGAVLAIVFLPEGKQ